MDEANWEQKLEFEVFAANGNSTHRNDRARPYNGQPWTSNGIRGKVLVKGLTMRDIRDCLVMAFLQAAMRPELHKKIEDGTWRWNDVYEIADIDFGAVGQCLVCNIEKMMGVFPNLKGCPSIEESMEELGVY